MTKRRVIQVVVALLLGAIVNVAVAWGCGAFVDVPWKDSSLMLSQALPPYWIFQIKRGIGSVQIKSDRATNLGEIFISKSRPELIPAWSRMHLPPDNDDGSWVVEDARGWPCLALRSQFRHTGSRLVGRITYPTFDISSGIRLSSGQDPWMNFERALPLAPIWPGFAINTVFYAWVLWMLFAFPFVLRRRRRIKRGLCPACAYPVGTSPVCTECGERLGGAGRRV